MELCYFDLETTGVDPYKDRIVEIAMRRGDRFPRYLVNPERSIPAQATEIHGITNEMVADAPLFSAIADEVQEMVDGATLVGYNSRDFDVPMLNEHLRNSARSGLLTNFLGVIEHPEIDLFQLWKIMEPRKLTVAARRFAGTDLGDSAHSAEADMDILVGVFQGMVAEFGLEWDPEAIMALSFPEDHVDREGKFKKGPDGKIRFNFGKHDGKPVFPECGEKGYVQWMLGADFSPEVKAWCRHFQEKALASQRGA